MRYVLDATLLYLKMMLSMLRANMNQMCNVCEKCFIRFPNREDYVYHSDKCVITDNHTLYNRDEQSKIYKKHILSSNADG